MSKIKTLQDLQDSIDKEYTWRFREICLLKDQLKEHKSSDKYVWPLSRSLVMLSYCHWEGFVKYSAINFFSYIRFISLTQSQLSPKFLASSIRHLCDGKKMSVAVEEILKCISNPSYKFSYDDKVLTSAESNLNYDVLTKIAVNIGVDISPLSIKQQMLDAVVLARRNDCAHGESVYTTYDYGIEVADIVIELMKLFKNQLQNMIALEEFKA